MGKIDNRIDDYIKTLPLWQQTLCRALRAVIHSVDPDIDETIKRTNRPYFVLNGNVCAFLGAKDHLNLFIYDPTVTDAYHLINQGDNNKTAKAIQFFENDSINETALRDLLREVVAHNRAGGWRQVSKLD